MKSLRVVLAAVVRGWKIYVMSILGSALLLCGAVLWLRIPEAKGWQLVTSALVAALLVIGALWMLAATFAYFDGFHRTGEGYLQTAFIRGLRGVPWMLLWLCTLIALLWLEASWEDQAGLLPDYLRSEMPLWVRQAVGVRQFVLVMKVVLNAVFFVMVPGVLLPWAAVLVRNGWRGLWSGGGSDWWRAVRAWPYWAVLLLAGLISMYAPEYLANWQPELKGMFAQTISMGLRLGLAYGLLVGGGMLAVSATTFYASYAVNVEGPVVTN